MTELAPIVSYLFVMSITPGPNNLMLTASGVNFGFSRTLPHMLGIVVGLTIQTYLTALGLGVLFTEIPIVRDGLKVVGVAYLLWMSWKIVGAQVANATEGARAGRSRIARQHSRSGDIPFATVLGHTYDSGDFGNNMTTFRL